MLNREEAQAFLEEYLGDVCEISENEFEEKYIAPVGQYSEDKVIVRNKYDCSSYSDWNEFAFMIPDQYSEQFMDFDHRVPLPDEAYREFGFIGTEVNAQALFVWNKQKIMIFEDEHDIVEIDGWMSYHCSDVHVNEFEMMF